MRLADGTLWPMPITFDVSEEMGGSLSTGQRLALRDPEGVMLAVLHVEEIWKPDLAAEAGCDVATTVGKRGTILVVGDQDVRKLAGHEKSSKHRRAESMIQEGQPIRIVRETDFRSLVMC